MRSTILVLLVLALVAANPVPVPADDYDIHCNVYHEDSDADGVGDLWVCGYGDCSDWGVCQGKTHTIDTDGDGSYDTDVTIDSCRCH